MKLQWKEVPCGDVQSQWSGLYITMNPKGKIVLARKTYQRLGEPKAFNILFCATNNIIGLKPCSPAVRNAYRACKSGPAGGRELHAYRLLQEYQISLPQTIQFVDPEIDHDGILQLDLRTAKVSPRSAGHYTRKKDRTADGTHLPTGEES